MISHRADDLLSPQVGFSLIIVQRIIRNAKSLYKLLLLDPMGTQLEFQFKILGIQFLFKSLWNHSHEQEQAQKIALFWLYTDTCSKIARFIDDINYEQ